MMIMCPSKIIKYIYMCQYIREKLQNILIEKATCKSVMTHFLKTFPLKKKIVRTDCLYSQWLSKVEKPSLFFLCLSVSFEFYNPTQGIPCIFFNEQIWSSWRDKSTTFIFFFKILYINVTFYTNISPHTRPTFTWSKY